MSQRIVVDPVTRIEGHLRIDVEVDGGEVRKAWSSGQMWRGIETILQGRDPRDAWMFTQRFCGVCTTVHAIASVRAVENAVGLEIPINAQYIRNIIVAAHAMHDHIVHFYHLSALDWVDVVSALEADPDKTASLAQSLSSWHRNSAPEFKAVKEKLTGFVERGQLGIFANGYWGHPAMKLPPEVNLMAVSHYLQALEYQQKVNKVVAILGSKTPNIQNLAVGGVANAINLDSQSTLNMNTLMQVKGQLDQGALGEVYCFSTTNSGQMPISQRSWFCDRESAGGGALIDHTVHLADIMRWYLGDEVVEVYAQANHILQSDKVDVETGALLMLTFANGVFATIDASWSKPLNYPTWGGLTMEIVSQRGLTTLDGFRQNLNRYVQDPPANDWLFWGSDLNQGLIDEFVAAIREERSPKVTGEDGYQALAIAMSAYESAANGRPVSLADSAI